MTTTMVEDYRYDEIDHDDNYCYDYDEQPVNATTTRNTTT